MAVARWQLTMEPNSHNRGPSISPNEDEVGTAGRIALARALCRSASPGSASPGLGQIAKGLVAVMKTAENMPWDASCPECSLWQVGAPVTLGTVTRALYAAVIWLCTPL